jgi:hypothetical protein
MVGRKTMNLKAGKKAPQIVFRGGEPSAVILDIEVYQEMLLERRSSPLRQGALQQKKGAQ